MNRPKLTGADKVKYQIHDEIVANLPKCNSYKELEKRLWQAGITIQYKYRSGAEEIPENIQGVSFKKDGIAFKGSEIDRKFSHTNLKKTLDKNMDELMAHILDIPNANKTEPESTAPMLQKEQIKSEPEPQTQAQKDVVNLGAERKRQEVPTATKPDYVNPKPTPSPQSTTTPTPVQPAAEPTVADQKLLESPHLAKRNPVIRGVEITDEQHKTLKDGGYIYLENMDKKDGSGKFSAYVFKSLDMKTTYFSQKKPDEFVQYGKYKMRVMDKRRLENGQLTRAKVE